MKKARNHPIAGDLRIIFSHVSPEHKKCTEVFELFQPELIRIEK